MPRAGDENVSLSNSELRILRLVSELRDRGVLHAKLKTSELELEVALQPSLDSQNQLTETQRQLLLDNPATPEEMKAKLRTEMDRDLYGSA